MRSVASKIWFPVDLHLVVHFKLLLSFFRCLGRLKECSWRSRLSQEPTGLFPGGRCNVPVQFRPRVLYHWYNDPISSKTRNVLSWFVLTHCTHGRSLEKNCWTKQVSYRWKLISYQAKVLIDSGVRIQRLRGATCIQHRHLWLFTVL